MELEFIRSNSFVLSNIIAIYKKDDSPKQSYIEVGIRKNEQFTFVPITHSDAKSVFSRLSFEEKVSIFPKNLIFYGNITQKAIIYFNKGKRLINYLGKWYNIPLPGLLIFINGNQINVYSFKKNGTPNMDTVLYKNPLPNGTVSFCVGTVKKWANFPNSDSIVKEIESVLFDGEFTNEYTSSILNNYTTETYKNFIKKLSKMKTFPNNELIKVSKLRDVIR